MSPPDDEGRPQARKAPLQVEPTETTIRHGADSRAVPLVERMAQLVQDLDAQRSEVREAYSRGRAHALIEMQDFGVLMWRGGYEQAHREMARAWKPVAEGVRELGRTKTHAELEQARWGGRREDFGKPRPGDFPGVASTKQEVA